MTRIFDTNHTYIDFSISLKKKSIIILMMELYYKRKFS